MPLEFGSSVSVSAFEIREGGNTSFRNNVIGYMPIWNPSELHLLGQLE